MRVYLVPVLALSLLFVSMPVVTLADDGVSSSYAQSAPADEYFGHNHESVLEIRNRLDALDGKSDSEMLTPDTVTGLDSLQDSILSWQKQYPGDPWIPHAMGRLVHCYARAGQASDPRASAVLNIMLSQYKDAPDTHYAMLAISNEPQIDDNAPSIGDANDVADTAQPDQSTQADQSSTDDQSQPDDQSPPDYQPEPVYVSAPVYQQPVYASPIVEAVPVVAAAIYIGGASAWSSFAQARGGGAPMRAAMYGARLGARLGGYAVGNRGGYMGGNRGGYGGGTRNGYSSGNRGGYGGGNRSAMRYASAGRGGRGRASGRR